MKKTLATCFAFLLFFCACAQPVQAPAPQEASSSVDAAPIHSEEADLDTSSSASGYKISPMTVFNPPLAVPLPAPDENGFVTLPISTPRPNGFKESYLLSLPYKDGIYWLDDSRAVFIESYNLYCLDLKTSEMKTLLATDLTDIWSGDIHPKPRAERFLLTSYTLKAEMMCSYDDGFFFGSEKECFIVPTYIPDYNAPSYRFHAYSCADLTPINTAAFDARNLSKFPHNILCLISSRGNLTNMDTYNGMRFRSDDPEPLQTISLIHPEQDPKIFELREGCEYQSWGSSISPSGDYYVLINLTKSQTDVVNPYSGAYPTDPVYFDVFDSDGKFCSEVYIDHWLDAYFDDQIYWDSGHDGKAKSKGVQKYLWDGEDRLYVRNRYFYANGEPVEKHVGYFLQSDEKSDFFNLMYRNEDGNEQMIKKNVSPAHTKKLIFNPSFTSCIWVSADNRPTEYMGFNQWELP